MLLNRYEDIRKKASSRFSSSELRLLRENCFDVIDLIINNVSRKYIVIAGIHGAFSDLGLLKNHLVAGWNGFNAFYIEEEDEYEVLRSLKENELKITRGLYGAICPNEFWVKFLKNSGLVRRNLTDDSYLQLQELELRTRCF